MIHTNPIESFRLKFGDNGVCLNTKLNTNFCYYPLEFKRARFLLASTVTVTVASTRGR